MDDSLVKRGHSLEELFFKQRSAELIAQHKKLEEMKKNKEVLAQISGIRNPKVLDKLIELNISPSVLSSLVILPLVEVAWADKHLDEKEKKAILDGAAKSGLVKGTEAYNLLEAWLKEPPSSKLLEAWIHYIEGLRETLSPEELNNLKSELLDRARKVAESAGGILGLSKISPEEQAVLKKMDNAFV